MTAGQGPADRAGSDPLLGVAAPLSGFGSRAREAADAARRIVGAVRDSATAADRLRDAAQRGGTTVARVKSAADAGARGLTTAGRSAATGSAGVKSFGGRVRGAGGALGALRSGLGGMLALIGGIALAGEPLAKLLDGFGRAMAVASVVMTAVNLAIRATPLGFVTGLLVPFAAYLIDLAVNSATGQRILQQVFTRAEAAFLGVLSFLGPVLRAIGAVVTTYAGGYLSVVLGVLKVVTALLSGNFPALGAAAARPLHALDGILSRVWDGLRHAVQPALDFLVRDIPRGFQRVKDATTRTLNAIGGFVATGLQAVVSVLKAPLTGLIGFGNWIIGGLNSIGFSVLGKHFGIHLDKIPQLGAGGIVLPATARGAGRVLPLADLDRRRLLPAARHRGPGDGPCRVAEFREKPADGPRGIAEDLLFLARAHAPARPRTPAYASASA
jgi:hypothetical protein